MAIFDSTLTYVLKEIIGANRYNSAILISFVDLSQ